MPVFSCKVNSLFQTHYYLLSNFDFCLSLTFHFQNYSTTPPPVVVITAAERVVQTVERTVQAVERVGQVCGARGSGCGANCGAD